MNNSYRVLLYHSVGEIDPRDNIHTRVSGKAFEEQMTFLDREGYNVTGLDEIISTIKSGETLKEKTLAVTFDDGYKDNLLLAAPVLRNHGFKMTIFISPCLLGKVKTKRSWQKWEYLSKSDVKELASNGYSIGSHSLEHKNLKELKPDEAVREITESKKLLEEIINKEVCGFSFPYGLYNNRLLDVTKKAGYQFACSTVSGINSALDGNLFSIKRTEISGNDDLDTFKAKLQEN